jgi:A nuclease family of the HNH/ENDO VII superfamily with conserved AHH
MQAGEGTSSGSNSKADKGETFDCKWSNCQKDHPVELTYPNGGNVSRGDNRGVLYGAGQEPWNGGGYGVATKPIYYLANGKVKIRKAADGSNFKEYRVQAHHLIPIKQMGGTSTLKENAKRAKWDINALPNAMFLPQDEMDIAIHELQRHHTKHGPQYTTPISSDLRRIERTFSHICRGTANIGLQMMILDELDALSEKAKHKILGMRGAPTQQYWPLRAESMSEFGAVKLEYARRKLIHTNRS